MKIVILPSARDDLADGFQFYETRESKTVLVKAVLDCRRNPTFHRQRLL